MTTFATKALLPAATTAAGSVGAIVGGAVAAARDAGRVSQGEMTKGEAVADVGKEAVGTGLATAAGVAVTGALGITGLLGLVSIVSVSAGAKYLWNKRFGFRPEPESAGA